MPRPPKPWFRKSRNAYYIEIGGKQRKLAEGPKTKENQGRAMLAYHQLMAEMLSNPPVDGGDPTVASIADEHLEYAVKRDAPMTFYERKLLLQKFCTEYGAVRVKNLKAFHLAKWVDSQPKWKSDWTKAYAIRIVKRAFNWAKKMGLIPENPFCEVDVPECEGERRPMTDEEFEALLAAAGPESHLGEILRFVCLTGCRPCELRTLRWSEVNLDDPLPKLVQKKHKTSKRKRKIKCSRTIFLVPEIVDLLTRIKARQDHPEFVFVSRRGRPWARSSIQQSMRRLRRQIGLPEDVVLYCLRHKFATNSIVRGVDIKTTGDLMGHTNTRMTEHYVDLPAHPEHLANAMLRATRSA